MNRIAPSCRNERARKPLSLVLFAGLTLCVGCSRVAPPGAADARLAEFIPAGTVVLAGVRVGALKKTPLYQEVAPLLGPIAQEGFDPRRDVEELLIASNGKDTCVLARGRFDAKELGRLQRWEHRGVPVYGNSEGAVALVDGSLAVAGTTPAVRAAIDQQKSGRRSGADLLRKASSQPAPNQIWMVSQGSPVFLRVPRAAPNAATLEKMLHTMTDVNFVADFREGVYAALEGRCASEADAKFLGDTVRGLIGLARLALPRSEVELIRALDGVSVAQTRGDLSVTAKIPRAVAAEVMERVQSLSRGEAEPRER
jgi:hypothetical protein